MALGATLKSVRSDVLAGFVALCLLILFVAVSRTNDLQSFSLTTCVLFFLAGFLRGGGTAQRLWLKAVLIALGGVVPVVAMRATGTALTAQGYVSLFILFSLLVAVAGVEARRLFSRGHKPAAFLLAAIVLGSSALAIVLATPLLVAKWSSQYINRPAPSFSFVTLDGKTVTSADLHGRVVVLVFWASWCVPCRQELPAFQETYERYKENSAVRFYAVGGPWGGDTTEKEKSFVVQMKLDLPFVFDSHGTSQDFGVSGFPSLVILDEAGRIRMVHTGYDASEHFAQHVSQEVEVLSAKRI